MKFWRVATGVFLSLLGLHSAGAGTLAQFRTVLGTLEVELYDQHKPATVQNFKRLVQSGAYQYTFFHRLEPGFVAQGGGFYTTIPFGATEFASPWWFLYPVQDFGTVTNEYNVGPRFSNTNGTIAMAKSDGDPNSASCQWFFNLGNNSAMLDNQNGGFTVFGHVIRDTGPTNYGGLMGFFNGRAYVDGIVNLQWRYGTNDPIANTFKTLPVTYPGTKYPYYSDLFYVDISLLNVQVTVKTNGNREISWNSVSSKTNYVEFTTNFPPVWNLLLSTNGTGSTLTAVDSAARGLRRFYRVRVAY